MAPREMPPYVAKLKKLGFVRHREDADLYRRDLPDRRLYASLLTDRVFSEGPLRTPASSFSSLAELDLAVTYQALCDPLTLTEIWRGPDPEVRR